MAGNKPLQDTLKAGIEAARRGDRVTARRLLRQVITADKNNEVAWMWLASAAETLDERRECLENTLRINPNNARAQEALSRLGGTPSPAGATPRRNPPRRPVSDAATIREERSSIVGYLIIAALVVAVLVAVIIGAGAILGQPALVSQATQAAIQDAVNNPSATPTALPSLTPILGRLVAAPSNVPTLPPTFTPTFTPLPPPTATPTSTLIPVANFTLLYTALNPGDTQPALYRSQGDGVGEVQLGASADGYWDVAYSPGGDKIAFVQTTTYTNDAGEDITAPELFIADPNNLAGARRVTHMGTDLLSNPTWAPDGIQLAFVSNFDGDEDLWYITEDGNNLRPLTSNDWRDTDPAWSPDGAQIVFASEQANRAGSGLLEIFSLTFGADEDTIIQYTDAEGSSYEPAWSPDGALITFVSDRGDDGDIYVMDADGQRPFLLTPDDSGAEDHSPAFAPDGSSIVFASNRESDTFRLYRVDLRGNLLGSLANTGHDNFQSIDFQPEPRLRFGQ